MQDPAKQAIAIQRIQNAAALNQVMISVISLQEISFVLSRLKIPLPDINQVISVLKGFNPLPVTVADFQRAETFAQSIGFQNINDCIHTTIAENHCTELITFNHSDFKKIQPLTNLKITLL
ncbi:MAG: PIN domain-containing protein [Saprospiraceae bacterium]|nr:PIN domain-containing protein [Saprospiraceae bacterium]